MMKHFQGLLLVSVIGLLLACQFAQFLPSSEATPTPTARPKATATRVAQSITLPTAPPPEPPSPTPEPVNGTVKENLRVRAAPNANAAVLDRLNKGDTVQIIGRTAASDWLQIPLPKKPDERGWVSATFVTVNGPVDTIPVAGSGQPNPPPAQPSPQPNPPPQPSPPPLQPYPPPPGAYPYP